MEQKIQQRIEELKKVISFPIAVYPTVENKVVLLIKQQDTSKSIDDWALNEIYPLFWAVRDYLKEHHLSKEVIPLFFCDDKFILFCNNNVITEMDPMPRGEWFNDESNSHFTGYCYDSKKLINFLTQTPNLKF